MGCHRGWWLTAACLLALGAALWSLRQPSAPARPVALSATPPAASPPPSPAPEPEIAPPEATRADSLAPKFQLSEGLLPWEEQIARVLASTATPRGKAQVLFSLLPTLPVEAIDTAAHTAVETLRDPDYAAIAQPVVVDPKTNGAILSVLFADLMERPDPIALPALLAIARTPDHPYAPYARDNLAFLLGHDWAADWPAWETAVGRRLTAVRAK